MLLVLGIAIMTAIGGAALWLSGRYEAPAANGTWHKGSVLIAAAFAGVAATVCLDYRISGLPESAPSRAMAVTGYGAWTAGLLVLALVDARTRVIPTTVVHTTGALTSSALITSNFIAHQFPQLLAGVMCALFTFFTTATWALLLPRTLGFGDVRLSTMVAFGAGILDAALCLAVISAAFLAAGALSNIRRKTGKAPRAIPLAPFLALVGLVCMVTYGA